MKHETTAKEEAIGTPGKEPKGGVPTLIKGIIFDFSRTLYDQEKDTLMDSALPLLEELKKHYQLCLVGRNDDVEKRKKHIASIPGFTAYFKKIIVNIVKSDKEFQECLNSMKLSPEEALVVGDKITGEITLGNRMGMATVWFRNGKFSGVLPKSLEEQPTYVITSLQELLPILQKIGNEAKEK
ncbi:HAD hydrolase-like protein [Candidatus Woesearchaeota archaeon]|nr:HAD hydrolase-like protein [Candidatus Woesearchaeota archaeon]